MLKKYNNRIVSMVNELIRASKAYYKGNPVMSDAEFDALEQKLREEDPENDYFKVVQVKGTEDVVFHPYEMLSQEKALNIDQLEQFFNRTFSPGLVETPKYDGMSIEIVISKGEFSASSRGDGQFGEDYTSQMALILGLETLINLRSLGDMVIRGEVILRKSSLVELNKQFVKEGKKPYANERNGVVGLFNNKQDGEKYLHFASIVIWDVLNLGNEGNL